MKHYSTSVVLFVMALTSIDTDVDTLTPYQEEQVYACYQHQLAWAKQYGEKMTRTEAFEYCDKYIYGDE